MSKIKIVADSTCDLSPQILEAHGIELVHLYINLGDRQVKDLTETNSKQLIDYVSKSGVLPGTMAPSIEDFKTVFEKWRAEGNEIICITISGDMSSTFQNAKIAGDEVGGVYTVDSRNLSTGNGHIVLNAALMAESGLNAAEIVKNLEELTPKVRSSFILDTLAYMKKGGRCSTVAALGANLLKIKPEIVVRDGKMVVGHKYRGTLKKVLGEYVDAQLNGRSDIRTDRIFVTHSEIDSELVEYVRQKIAENIAFGEIIETAAGGTITSHCGPNTIGILYLVK